MPTRRHHEYQDPVSSFDLDNMKVGMFQPGRYRGWDKFTTTGALTCKLEHQTGGDGVVQIDPSAVVYPIAGVALSPQGVTIIQESDTGVLTIGTNAANPYERIDAVILEHTYNQSVQFGSPETYSIIQGPNGGPIYPSAADPTIQIILGYIRIPASAVNLGSATYELKGRPGLANVMDAKLYLKNKFGAIQEFNQGVISAHASLYAGVSDGITLNDAGNLFKISVTEVPSHILGAIKVRQKGTVIKLWNTGGSYIALQQTPSSGFDPGVDFGNGYRRIQLSDGITDVTLAPYNADLINMKPGDIVELTMVSPANAGEDQPAYWQVTGYSDYLYDKLATTQLAIDTVISNSTPNICEAHVETAYSEAATTEHKILFDTLDEGSGYSTSTHRFTPGKLGWYRVTARLLQALATHDNAHPSSTTGLAVRKNGTFDKFLETYGGLTDTDSAGVDATFEGSVLVKITNIADYLEIWYETPITITGGYTVRGANSSGNRISWVQFEYVGDI